MARLPALIDEFAAHDPRGRPAIWLIARNIREAGLIATTKRGRGAAEMTARDSATLLIGLGCAAGPKDAPEIVRKFCSLISDPDPLSEYDDDYPETLLEILTSKTLLDCFELFIKKPHLLDIYSIRIHINVTYFRVAINIVWRKGETAYKFRHLYIASIAALGKSFFVDDGPYFVWGADLSQRAFYSLYQILNVERPESTKET